MKAGSNVTCVWIFREGQLAAGWVGVVVLGERPLVSLNADPLIFPSVLTSSFICSLPEKSVPHNGARKHGAGVGKSGDAKERQLEDNAGKFPEKKKKKKKEKGRNKKQLPLFPFCADVAAFQRRALGQRE